MGFLFFSMLIRTCTVVPDRAALESYNVTVCNKVALSFFGTSIHSSNRLGFSIQSLKLARKLGTPRRVRLFQLDYSKPPQRPLWKIPGIIGQTLSFGMSFGWLHFFTFFIKITFFFCYYQNSCTFQPGLSPDAYIWCLCYSYIFFNHFEGLQYRAKWLGFHHFNIKSSECDLYILPKLI